MIMHKTVHTVGLILAESADSLIIQLTLFTENYPSALSAKLLADQYSLQIYPAQAVGF
jgi:hypothetical protein